MANEGVYFILRSRGDLGEDDFELRRFIYDTSTKRAVRIIDDFEFEEVTLPRKETHLFDKTIKQHEYPIVESIAGIKGTVWTITHLYESSPVRCIRLEVPASTFKAFMGTVRSGEEHQCTAQERFNEARSYLDSYMTGKKR